MLISKAWVWGLALLACVHGSNLSAQSFGFFGGTSTLVGRSADSARTGYHVGGFIEFAMAYRPLAIRAALEFQQTTGITAGPGQAASTDAPNVTSLSVEAVFRTPRLGVVHPYLLGSIGLYRFGGGPTLIASNRDNHDNEFGAAVGIGGEIQLQRIRLFGEVHYHSIAGVQILPISVGVRF